MRRKNEENKRSDSIEWHCTADPSHNHPPREPVPDVNTSAQKPPPQTVSRLQKVLRACCCVKRVHLDSKHAIRFLIESLHKPRTDEDIVNCFHPDFEEPQSQDAQSKMKQSTAFCDHDPRSGETPPSPMSVHSSKDIIVDVENHELPSTQFRDDIRTVNFQDVSIDNATFHDPATVSVHDEDKRTHRSRKQQMERSSAQHGSNYNTQSVKVKRKLFSGSHHIKGEKRITPMKQKRKLLRRTKRSSAAKCIISRSDTAAAESSSLDTVADIHHQTMETSVDTIATEDLVFQEDPCSMKDSGYCNEAMEEDVNEIETELAVDNDNAQPDGTYEENINTPQESPNNALCVEVPQEERLDCKVDIHSDKTDIDQQFWESTL